MARLTKDQRSELRHIRNEAFKRNLKKGASPRHPNKPVTVYEAKPTCVRVNITPSPRPDSLQVNYGDVLPVDNANKKPVTITSDGLDAKIRALGWTRDDWNLWKEASRKDLSLTLHDYRNNLSNV